MQNMKSPGALGDAAGALEVDRAVGPINSKDNPDPIRQQAAAIIAERRRAEWRFIYLDTIATAAARGLLPLDVAAERVGVPAWPDSLVTAAIEWRASRYGRVA